jgi:uncharacterized protein
VSTPVELSAQRCLELLGSRGVGRAAVCGPSGPQICPVNYVVDGHSVVFRTSAYSALGSLSPGADIAFEVDHLDHDTQSGWSVVANGPAVLMDDPAELDMLRERGLEPTPWASGLRRTYIRLSWTDISGREVVG